MELSRVLSRFQVKGVVVDQTGSEYADHLVKTDSSGKLAIEIMPSGVLMNVTTVANQAARLALAGTLDIGDIVIQTDTNVTYMLTTEDGSDLGDWTQIAITSSPTATQIVFSPTGSISATNVQAAIAELDSEKQPLDAQLTALSAVTVPGIMVWDGLAFLSRDIIPASSKIQVNNGNGVSDSPSIDVVDNELVISATQIADFSVTDAEFQFLAGVTSAIQTQLNGKASTTHATTHQSGGGDPIKLDDLAAPDDNTDLDATAIKHGLMAKLDKIKLIGIEDNADVTDATNVDAAGAVMNSDTSTAAMSFVIDEDSMASDSATKVPTQQSVKAYVDANIGGGSGSMTTVLDSGTPLGDPDIVTLNFVDGFVLTETPDTQVNINLEGVLVDIVAADNTADILVNSVGANSVSAPSIETTTLYSGNPGGPGSVVIFGSAGVSTQLTSAALVDRSVVCPDKAGYLPIVANGTGLVNVSSEITGVLGSSNGGAGTVNGIVKANGSGTTSAAVAGTDYLAPAAIGSTVQGYDATLAALAGATTGANTMPYWTGTDTVGNTGLTSFGRSLVDDADNDAALITLGLTGGTKTLNLSTIVAESVAVGITGAGGILNIVTSAGNDTQITTASTGSRTVGIPDASGYFPVVDDSGGRVDVSDTAEITGTLAITNGGTGATSLNDLITLGTHTTGDYAATVSGTTNRITTSGSGETAAVTVDIAATYVGQSSITTLGTITSGTWNGTAIDTTYIADDAVTNAKLANMTASTIKARKTGSTGDPEDCTLTEVLDLVGSAAQGDLLYRNSSAWTRLGAGTSGYFLKTQGAAANPIWDIIVQGTKTLDYFLPTDNEPPASNFATLDTRNSHPVLDFDTTTQETAIFRGVIPANVSLAGGVTVYAQWAATSATSGTIGWDVAFERITSGGLDIDGDSFGTAQTITATTVSGTSGITLVSSVNFSQAQLPASLTNGDMYRLRIRRDVANDSAAGDAELLMVVIALQ